MKIKVLILILILIAISLTLILIIFNNQNKYDRNCLEEKGRDFCEENHDSFIASGYHLGYSEWGIFCSLNYDIRDRNANKEKFYLFTEQEKESCLE